MEMHVYGEGSHGGGDIIYPERSKGLPFATWHLRFFEWMGSLGFLDPPGTSTKAAADLAEFASQTAAKEEAAEYSDEWVAAEKMAADKQAAYRDEVIPGERDGGGGGKQS